MGQGSRAAGAGGSDGVEYSVGTRKIIQSIKEIVGDHSDADIYSALKEAGMDPNEAAAKLLSQDTFHEVRRKGDKKENANYEGSDEPKGHLDNTTKWPKISNTWVQNSRRRNYARNASSVIRDCLGKLVMLLADADFSFTYWHNLECRSFTLLLRCNQDNKK